MKIFKRLFAITVSLLIIAMLLPTPALAADEPKRFGRDILAEMDNSSALLYAYDKLVEGCKNTKSSISVEKSGATLHEAEFKTVYRLMRLDYPEYFWLGMSYGYSVKGGTDIVVSASPDYSMTGAALSTAKTKFNNKLSELTEGLSGKSDYEKSLILHDRVANAVTYQSTDNDQTAYGALIEGKAVCAGYATAYHALLNKVGIDAWSVLGTSNNPSTGNPEYHQWNLVYLDDKPYYTDVTWDDQEDTVYYAYLNVTSKQINEDHTVTDFANHLPNATATANNYFVKNSLVFSGLNVDSVAKLLKNNGNTARVYITGDLNSFTSDLNSKMKDIIAKMGAPASSKYGCFTKTLGREYIITVNIVEENHEHKLTAVAKKEATCNSKGSITYYACTCGKWFADATAKKEITNRSSVETPALSHIQSGWKTNAIFHWKECTRSSCGIELINTRAAHKDANKDDKCDTCGYDMKNSAGGTVTPPPATENSSAEPTSSGTAAGSSTANDNPASQEQIEAVNSSANTDSKAPSDSDKDDKGTNKIGLILGISIPSVAIIAILIKRFLPLLFNK